MSHPFRMPPLAARHRIPSPQIPSLHNRVPSRSRAGGDSRQSSTDRARISGWVGRCLCAVALSWSLSLLPAVAATLTVDAMRPDISPDGSCSLIEAIENANATGSVHSDCALGTPGTGASGADTIELPSQSTQTLTAAHNTLFGPTGLPVIRSAITLEGHGATLLRGADASPFRILAVAEGGRLTLRDIRVRGGTASPPFDDGGGILNRGGTITLRDSTVSGNSAGDAGGGLHNASGSATLIDSTVSENTAAVGGGVANSRGVMKITATTISDNGASGQGGGIANLEGGNLLLGEGNISGNHADDGGGIWNVSGTATVTQSTVSDNRAGPVGGGGGIVNFGGALSMTNTTLFGNHSSDVGGGVATVLGTTRLVHTTVSQNVAKDGGGGVFNFGGTVTLSRSLVAGNTAPTAAEVHNFTGIIEGADFNLLGHDGLDSAAAFQGFMPGGLDRAASSDGDLPTPLSALIEPAADNGGFTRTMALVAGSPAVDAVSGASCRESETDQRGIARPQNGDGDSFADCDIGAYELASRPCGGGEDCRPTPSPPQ